jgi:hypothetical protein
MAVAALAALVKSDGPVAAAEVLKVLAAAERAPISAPDIRAMTHLLTDGEFMLADVADYPAAIKALGVAGDREAAAFAATHRLPLWKGLASTWFKKVRKRRQAAPAAPAKSSTMHLDRAAKLAVASDQVANLATPKTVSAPTAKPSQPADKVTVTATLMGDPAPTRSALAVVRRIEPRPARGGWKPGVFSRRCGTCDELFTGHKDATTCEACEYEGATA